MQRNLSLQKLMELQLFIALCTVSIVCRRLFRPTRPAIFLRSIWTRIIHDVEHPALCKTNQTFYCIIFREIGTLRNPCRTRNLRHNLSHKKSVLIRRKTTSSNPIKTVSSKSTLQIRSITDWKKIRTENTMNPLLVLRL